jgi:hypothetical protein
LPFADNTMPNDTIRDKYERLYTLIRSIFS